MANKIQGMLDETIENAIEQLNRLDKGSPEYNQMVTNIAKLNEQRLKEAELDAAEQESRSALLKELANLVEY